MKISDRLTRAGAALLIFGTCATMLPGNSGSFMTASDACPTNSHNSFTTGDAVAAAAAALLITVLVDPSLFGLNSAGAAGATGVIQDPVTGLFSYIYGPEGSPAQ